MVTLGLRNNRLTVKLSRNSYAVFNTELTYLKEKKFRWNSKEFEWVGPSPLYQEIKEYFENIDSVKDEINSDDISETLAGKPEQFNEPVRRIPDLSLMSFPPMKGKAPNENFQYDAIRTTINKSRFFVAWGMGSGKSYVLSSIIAHRRYKYNDCSKVIVLTTSIGVKNLYHEIGKFIKDIDMSRIKIVTKDNRDALDPSDKSDILIMSYNTFRLMCNHYKDKAKIKSSKPRKPFLPIKDWCHGKEAMLILDESHEVANVESQRSYLVSLHASLFKYRYLFSGTPADKPEKMYNQFNILDPYLVYNLSYNDWKNKHAELGDRYSAYAIREWKKEELEKQNKRFLKSYGSYFKTTDLVDLPEYNVKKIYLDMNPKHRFIYENVVVRDIPTEGTSRDIANRFPYQSMAIDNPFLLEKHSDKFDSKLNKAISSFHESYLEKLSALDDIMETHPDDQILIWCVHPSTIEMIGKRYKKYNPICIDGSSDQDLRFEMVEEFKKNKSHKLLIANITCLNTSVTITECKIQVYVERSYNFSQFSQSTQRIYRISQTEDVTTYILIYNSSLDCFLDKNLDSKGTLVEGLVSKGFLTQDQWVRIYNMTENDNVEFLR